MWFNYLFIYLFPFILSLGIMSIKQKGKVACKVLELKLGKTMFFSLFLGRSQNETFTVVLGNTDSKARPTSWHDEVAGWRFMCWAAVHVINFLFTGNSRVHLIGVNSWTLLLISCPAGSEHKAIPKSGWLELARACLIANGSFKREEANCFSF